MQFQLGYLLKLSLTTDTGSVINTIPKDTVNAAVSRPPVEVGYISPYPTLKDGGKGVLKDGGKGCKNRN